MRKIVIYHRAFIIGKYGWMDDWMIGWMDGWMVDWQMINDKWAGEQVAQASSLWRTQPGMAVALSWAEGKVGKWVGTRLLDQFPTRPIPNDK